MGDVTVLVLHPPLPAGAGPLTAALDAARRDLARRHLARFAAAGAAAVRLIEEATDEPFGARLRRHAGSLATPGVVVLGSGAIPLARALDYRALVAAAAAEAPGALANNRFSADVVALSRAAILRDLPDLPADNALPRWLEEVAGCPVADLRRRAHLALDLDSPADVLLAGGSLPAVAAASPLPARLADIRSVMADRHAELTVAGRTSSATLGLLERRTACRVRALVEERGLRAASRLAVGPGVAAGSPGAGGSRGAAGSPGGGGSAGSPGAGGSSHLSPAGALSHPSAAGASFRPARPPASVLGLLLDRDGPEALGAILAQLCDAAVIDSRVLLAHRLGADERAWPLAEDRFASDLLLPDRIADPWLRALTTAAAGAPVPVVLGGHTLVGPGLRILARRRP